MDRPSEKRGAEESGEQVELAFIRHLTHAYIGLCSYIKHAYRLGDHTACRLPDHADWSD